MKNWKRIIGTALAVMSLASAQAQSLSGTVTDAGGVSPLEGIQVVALSQMGGDLWDPYAEGITDAAGNYEIWVNPFSTYRIQFNDPTGQYATEYYDHAATVSQATSIAVELAAVSNLNASLPLAGKISGTVTGPGAIPLGGIWVGANVLDGEWMEAAKTITDATGAYELTGLLPGTYRVEFGVFNDTYASQVFDQKNYLDEGADIVVTGGASITNINASLVTGAQITGTITLSDGGSLYGVGVEAYRMEGGVWRRIGYAYPEPGGGYAMTGLPAGTYRVRFTDWNFAYAEEVYDKVYDLADGTDIIVTDGATVSGIDADLDPMPAISGRVTEPDGITPLAGIRVTPYRWDGSSWVKKGGSTDFSNADGTYLLEKLTPGTYRIGFHDSNDVYLDKFHTNAPSIETATDIVVEESVSGLVDVMDEASWINGFVSGPGGVALGNITVSAYVWNVISTRWDRVNYVFTEDKYGHYQIGALRAGTYRIMFSDGDGIYADQVFDGATTLASGTDVIVPAASTVSDIDATLVPASLEPPVLRGLRQTGAGIFTILFTGIEGQNYMLQETASLTNAWSDVGDPVTCTPGTNSILRSSSAWNLFWRIRMVP
jgi:hypothetical protein